MIESNNCAKNILVTVAYYIMLLHYIHYMNEYKCTVIRIVRSLSQTVRKKHIFNLTQKSACWFNLWLRDWGYTHILLEFSELDNDNHVCSVQLRNLRKNQIKRSTEKRNGFANHGWCYKVIYSTIDNPAVCVVA